MSKKRRMMMLIGAVVIVGIGITIYLVMSKKTKASSAMAYSPYQGPSSYGLPNVPPPTVINRMGETVTNPATQTYYGPRG